jgi:ABC-type nickel/cobalt efflux system permease component RcnA
MNISSLVTLMDERPWLRMLVCFTPGLVIGKLAAYQPAGSVLSIVSTVLLIIGVGLYLAWGRLRAKLAPGDVSDDEVVAELDDVPVAAAAAQASASEQLHSLAELRALCGEAERESDRLISLELKVNPQLSFAEATRSALARKKLQ